MKREHDLWWPDTIGNRATRYTSHVRDSDVAVRLLPKDRRRTAVQGGGFNGLWALRLAAKFRHVVTAECEPQNFRSLEANIAGRPRIEAFQAAWADRAGTTTFEINLKNAGGGKCCDAGALTVATMTIDSLERDDVDLIYLDVEGMELSALRGAEATIARSRPIIGIENRNHGAKVCVEWRWDEASMFAYLHDLGYEEAHRIANDVIFAPK